MCYTARHSSKPSTPSSVADDWRSAVAELSNRLISLESRFEELRAVGIVSMPEVEGVAAIADLAPSVVADDAGAETVEPVAVETVEAGAVNKSLEDWEKAVIAMYKAGITNYQHIADQTYTAGFQNANGNKRDRGHTRKVLVKAGLVEVKDGSPEAN